MNSFFYRNILRGITAARRQPFWSCLQFLEKSQYWKPEQIYAYQENKLVQLLRHCNRNVPFYQEWFKNNSLSPEEITLDNIDLLPAIDKNFLRENLNLLTAKSGKGKYEKAKTSGSTGIPLHFPKSLSSTAFQLAAMYRGHMWHGVEPGDREARLWGIPVDPLARMKTRATDLLLNRFREREYNLNHDVLLDFFHTLLKKKPVYLMGYTSMVIEFAHFLEELNKDGTQLELKMVKCTSETISETDHEIIERVFGCPLVSEYGAAETGLIAFQCEKGSHHLMSDCCIVELLEPEDDFGNDSLKEVIVTNLDNTALPIVRYKIGDLAIPSVKKCKCGRGLPIIDKIVGRESDIIVSQGGRKWHSIIIYYIMKGLEGKHGGVKQFKVIQKDFTTLQFLLITDDNFNERSISYIKQQCVQHFGPNMNVELQCVDFIPREKSGKLKDFVSLVR